MFNILKWGIVSVALGLAAASCSSSDTSKIQPVELGGRGESCQARNDCKSGLACVNQRCTQNDFAIAVTAKQCDLIACEGDDDCCTDSLCVSLKTQCTAGLQTACSDFDLECASCKRQTCDTTTNRCVLKTTCTTSADCLLGGTCTAGKCVVCTADTQCSTGQKCTDGQCTKDECTDDTQCAAFNKCQSGKCVYTGCTSDRDCYFSTGNPLSKCTAVAGATADAAKQCQTPCETDAECASVSAGTGTGVSVRSFQKCQAGACVFVGCDNDDQCREYLGVAAANPLSKTHAVCR